MTNIDSSCNVYIKVATLSHFPLISNLIFVHSKTKIHIVNPFTAVSHPGGFRGGFRVTLLGFRGDVTIQQGPSQPFSS